jgi:hypothetical protein
VRGFFALAAGVLCCAALGGCAALSGLAQYGIDDCADGCDAAATADAMNEAGDDGGGLTETGPGPGSDARTDANEDARRDAPVDTGTVAMDCGATDTVNNCGACGVTCDPVNGSGATCTGTTCRYTCNAGYADCNASKAPDSDGCECATATMASQGTVGGCCSGACQTQHSNGIGGTFFDCNPPDTYTAATALAACTAFTGDVTQCSSLTCKGSGGGAVICSKGASVCDCWQYQGTLTGRVDVNSNTTCYCAISSDPSWN